MKLFSKLTPHDPLDDLLAAALLGDLTPEERAQFDLRLQNDPAARAAYQETLHMHDLLEKSYRDAQPDPAFEERMVSGVRRKIRDEKEHRETAWESAVVLWRGVRGFFGRRRMWQYGAVCVVLVTVALTFVASEGVVNKGVRNPQLVEEMQREAALKEAKTAEKSTPRSDLLTVALPSLAAPQSTSSTPTFGIPAAPAATTPADVDSSAVPMNAPPAAPVAETATTVATDEPRATDQEAMKNVTDAKAGYSGPGGANMNLATLKMAPSVVTQNGLHQTVDQVHEFPHPTSTPIQAPNGAPEPTRKLVRNASLDLEVKSFQATVDALTTMVNAGGGYVDSSNSQRGGNGKLQGTVVVKVLPEKLDAFLLKLRDLGEIKNQSVSTEDVTKAYYDTQARLDNSRRMETQLQDLLKRDNGKVSELLQVERELGRVRGEIEQMQGELKVYDFEVQYATVTVTVEEKDLNQAAAYLLRERDEFSLFAPDVEAAFQQARQAADDFKGHVLNADLSHNSDSNISAMLVATVPPDQIDGFLARIKTLGRIDNFTRQTQRVANDGGESDQPADATKTEKDPVLVHLSIRSDDATPLERTQLSVVATGDIDAQAHEVKQEAAQAGAAVTASSFERATDGTETANLSFRLSIGKAPAFLETLKALGKVESLTVHRNDQPNEAQVDENAPAQIDLVLHTATVREQTQLSIVAGGEVDAGAQKAKDDAAKAGAAVTASSFARETDGTETADLTFRVPLGKAPAFMETLKALGKVESLSIHRDDQPGAVPVDESAPAEISLHLHNEPAIVADDSGLWPTLRHTFGDGITAFLGSVQTIGVLVAFVLPWLVVLVVLAWAARRVYVMRKR